MSNLVVFSVAASFRSDKKSMKKSHTLLTKLREGGINIIVINRTQDTAYILDLTIRFDISISQPREVVLVFILFLR